jgi:hypothetical protein
MSPALATAVNVVLGAAIVISILALLIWGIVVHRRDVARLASGERRRGRDRRRQVQARPAMVERRRGDRRGPAAIASA